MMAVGGVLHTWVRRGPLVVLLAVQALLLGGAIGAAIPASAQVQVQGITIERDLEYARPDGYPLRLDAYVPPGRGPHPGLLLIHGGGWRGNDKTGSFTRAMEIALEGFAVFAPDYRLAPQYPYPAAVEDVQAAVRWIRERADRFGVDPRRIGAIGGSSGGHLAAMLATLGEGSREADARVRAVVSWSGPMDLDSLLREGDPTARMLTAGFLDCPIQGPCPPALAASPITYVDPSDGAIFMANATREPIPLSQATDMAEALERVGVPHQVVEVPGQYHGQTYLELPVGPSEHTVWQASVDFLRVWLNERRPPALEGLTPPGTPEAVPPAHVPTAAASSSRPEGSDANGPLAALGAGVLVLLLASVTRRAATRATRRS